MPVFKMPLLLRFLACLLLFGFALYSPVLFGGQALYFRDVYHNYYTQLHFMRASLLQGELPFWNPLLFAGNPQMAVLEPPLFYPPGWLFFSALPFQLALVSNLLFHHLLAGCGIYLFGQRFAWSFATRLLVALFFCFSGVMASLHSFHPLQNTIAWLPLIWWAFQTCLSERKIRPLLWLSLFYGLQILSGHLEIVYFESVLLLGYALWFLRQGVLRPSDTRASQVSKGLFQLYSLVWGLLALGLGVGLSALQWLPALAHLPETVRAEGLGEWSMVWSYHPFLSLLLLLPDYLNQTVKGVSLHQYWGEPLYAMMPFFINGYLGLFPFLLLGAGLKLFYQIPQRVYLGFFSLLTLLLLMMAWGKYFPLYTFFLGLPGMGFFRYPSKLLVFVSLGLSLATGFVFQTFLETPAFLRHLWQWSLGLAVLLLGGLLALQTQVTANLSHLRGQLLAAALLALGISCWSYFWGKRAEIKGWGLGLLLGGIGLDLLLNGLAALPLAPSAALFESASKPAQYLLQQRLAQNSQARMLLSAPPRVLVPPTYAPQWQDRPELRFNAFHHASLQNNFNLTWGFRNAYGETAALSHKGQVMNRLYFEALALNKAPFKQVYESLLAVRYVLVLTPDAATTDYYDHSGHYLKHQTYPEMQLTLYENKDALPRARFQYQSMAIKDPTVIPALLAEPQSKSGIDFRSRVLLTDDQALKHARALVPAQEAREKRWQGPHFKVDKNNHLELEMETNTSGYVVLADQHMPGWRAWDNGQETPILSANFFMRAIRVGPGKHQIVMRYEPPGFVAGLWLSLVSGLIWLGLLAWGALSQRRSPTPDLQA